MDEINPATADWPDIKLYTDGSCLCNPGPGGYGIVLLYGQNRWERSGGYRLTTNNRMELLAAIHGLELLTTPCKVSVYTDSQYLSKAVTEGWLTRWQANGWRLATGKRVQNVDLWQRLVTLLQQHGVSFHWVEGHSGVEENEACDKLASKAARSASRRETFAVDLGYESGGNGSHVQAAERVTVKLDDEYAITNQAATVRIYLDGKLVETVTAHVEHEAGADGNAYPVVKLQLQQRGEFD